MRLIEAFELLFASVFLVASFSNIFTIPDQLNKKNSDTCGQANNAKQRKWDKRIRNSLYGLMVIGSLAGFIILILKFKKYRWILFCLSLTTYLEYTVNTYQSVSVLKDLVTSREEQPLSEREDNALLFVSNVLCLLIVTQIPQNMIEVISTCTNDILTDALTCAFYVVLLFTYLFFIFVYIPKIVYNFSFFLEKIYRKKTEKSDWIKLRNYFIGGLYNKKSPGVLTIYLINYLNTKEGLHWKIGYIFIPVIYIIDLSILVIWNLYVILCQTIGHALHLLMLLRNSLRKCFSWMIQLTTKRATAIVFRISLILALVFVVAWNRYSPIFRLFDASTAVFEFVASAIIIPIMFEWVISIKRR